MKNIVYFFCVIMTNFVFGQNCSDFNAPNDGKPVKVTFYTESETCFTLYSSKGSINTEPSKRVVFYMDYGVLPVTVNMNDGQVVEKKVMAGNTLASVVMELVYNEKKGMWDIKNRLGQGEVTAEEKARQDDQAEQMRQKQEADKAARDKEWEEKRAAEAAEREKAKENEQPKYTIQKVDTKVDTDIQKVDTKLSDNTNQGNGRSSSGNNAIVKEGEITKGAYEYAIKVVCNEKPVKNTYLTLYIADLTYGTCLTNEEGICDLKAVNEINCNLPINMKGQKGASAGGENANANASSEWKIEGYFAVPCTGPKGYVFHLEHAAKQMAEMSGMSVDSFLMSWGCGL